MDYLLEMYNAKAPFLALYFFVGSIVMGAHIAANKSEKYTTHFTWRHLPIGLILGILAPPLLIFFSLSQTDSK